MRYVEPEIYLIGSSVPNDCALHDYLTTVDAPDWRTDRSGGEALAECGGRLCYRSWKPGLNANVTKVREGNRDYLANILAQHHGSVLEHAVVSFIFRNVSRVFTHELVRHRAGSSFSQESLRYVRLTEIGFYLPDCFAEDEEARRKIEEHLKAAEDLQRWFAERYELDDDSTKFAEKKKITSAMRRLAPLGLATAIMWTANVRTIRHVLALRTALGAEEEIRKVFDKVGALMMAALPNAFQDFERTELGEWKPKHEKV